MAKKETSDQKGNINTVIWDSLCKTDPDAAKDFTRGGGFRGTAIKPIWQIEQMTKLFGPIGKGWGIFKPEFKIHELTNGEVLVFCMVEVWYIPLNEPLSSQPMAPVVIGIGGDKILKKTKNGLDSDDEAYKKAYTDAMTNAFKHLGMSADIHSGQFDGNKYVEEERPQVSEKSEPKKARGADTTPEVKEAREVFTSLKAAIQAAGTEQEAIDLYNANYTNLEKIGSVSPTGKEQLMEMFLAKAPLIGKVSEKKPGPIVGSEVTNRINDFINTFTINLDACQSDDDVMKLANENAQRLDWLQINDKDRYATVQASIDRKINQMLGA